jgi:D-alanyl-D-alanine carboxypeptidase/D-alanyl-D-alanine-endopeptidase (penicillin-binding protein 4)
MNPSTAQRHEKNPMKSARAALFCLLVSLVFSSEALAQAGRLPAPVARALAAAAIPESSVALYVHEIGSERALLSFGAERPLNPASTIKLLTTYAGLDLLGPAYAWNTEIYAAGTLQQEVLTGDLYIKGYGDPKLTLENFWLLLRSLRARGVRDIRGDLVLDRSYFTVEDHDPSRFDDQPTRPYNTGPDALLVNLKAITVQFMPDEQTRTLRIVADPQMAGLQVVNNVTLSEGPCGDWMARLKTETTGSGRSARLAFGGSYPRDCGERVRYFSVLGHRDYVGGLFTQLWKEMGGSFEGNLRDGVVPPGARLVVTGKSPSMSEVVRDVNKYSNNVMARQLYLTLGAAAAGAPATLDKSRRALTQWLGQKSLQIPELVLDNGSGLSRLERISARGMGLLLLDAYRSPVMPEFIASLPVVAVDGTMRKRLKSADVGGQAHIKTGSLTGVRAIGGYVLDAQGRRVVVAFIVNHANAASAQAAQDALLQWVYER